MSTQTSSNFIEYIYNNDIPFTKEQYEIFKNQSRELLITPLKVMALLVAISGLFAMIFEVRYMQGFAINVYITRLTSTLIAFIVLAFLFSESGKKKTIWLVHVLLLTIIISTGYMIYLIPSTLVFNAQIVSLLIFTSALFLSWEVKNQIIVAIYYNLVFAAAILLNDAQIYFLPNMYESVLFVLFFSMISVIASAVNFKLRMQLAEKNFRVEMSEKKYRSIFNNSAEGIFQTSINGKFLTVNESLVKLLGYESKEDLIKINIGDDVYKFPNERQNIIRELKDKGEIRNVKVTLKKKNGSDIVVRLNDRMIKNKGNDNVYFEGNMQDITKEVIAEEKRIEAENALKIEKEKSDKLAKEAQKSNVIKSQFLANMSHEIRTPLNGIIGYLTLIEMEAYENKEEMKQFSLSAKQSAESLLVIINDILDLSKIESGKMELEETNFNISELIDQSVAVLLTKTSEKNISIYKEVLPNTPIFLRGDPTRVRQIFLNLLSNAIKFTEKGEIKIKINKKKIAGNKVTLNVSVEDTGIGIPKEKVNSLFNPFTQADGSHTRKYGGTGLGLVICKEFVNMMGGDISIESVYGKGSKFFFDISLTVQESAVSVKESKGIFKSYGLKKEFPKNGKESKSTKTIRSKYKVLIAEDNPVNQKVAQKMIAERGYKAYSVFNGIEALEAIKREHYDVVLMDVQMPEMDGFTCTSEIRKLPDEKSTVPIIAITAHALAGDKEKCLNAGMNDYVTKPIDPVKLIQAIDNLLQISFEVEAVKKEESSNGVIFDFKHLENVSMGNKDFEKEILNTYIEDISKRYINLETLISDQDFKKITNEAHTIKGASYSIGAKKVGDEALAIEISGKHNDLGSLSERIIQFNTIFEETKEILFKYINNGNSN